MPEIYGDWRVEIDDDVPDHVAFSFSEMSEEGIFGHKIYLPPETADAVAKGLTENAQHIRENCD